MIQEYFFLATKNFGRRKLRSWLTVLGIFLSILVIFVLVSLSLGLQEAVQEQFRQLGTDKFFVQPKGQLGAPGTGGAATLTIKDVETLEKLSGVSEVTWAIVSSVEVEFNDEKRFVSAGGLDLENIELYEESANLKMNEGRFIRKGDSKDVALGSYYKNNNLFSKPVVSGSSILVNGVKFKVRGIVEPIGNPADDKNVYLPAEQLREISNITERIDVIIVQVQPGQELKDVAERANKRLLRERDVDEKTKDFTIQTPEELLSTFDTILNLLTGFLLGVAAISLLVGSIGIANTMYTAVLERRKEIGVMKAVGARNSAILTLFTLESGFLGLVGGIVGVILGIIVSKLVEYIAVKQYGITLLQVSIPVYLVIGCLVFAFVIGAVSGLWPAWQGAKIRPVQALRYE